MKRVSHCIALSVVALACAGPVLGQTTPGAPPPAATATEQAPPLMGSQDTGAQGAIEAPAQPDADALAALSGFGGDDGVYRILVVGDALAGGLGAGMTRMAQNDPRFEIVNRFNESSGLARPEFYDWSSAIPKMLTSQPYDAVVMLVGVNDRQDFRDGQARYAFRSPQWTAAYEQQVDRTLAAISAQGVPMFWVSLPPMANGAFDSDMQFLTELQQKHVAANKGTFIDVRPFFRAADGSYVDRGVDDTGTERKLRARDGVTFFKQGNNRYGQLVLGAIKAVEKLPAEGAVPAVAAAQPEPAVQPATQAPQGPVFGQQGSDGDVFSFEAASVAASAPATTAAPVADKEIDVVMAAKGSAAARLMSIGAVAAAPAGRFDDAVLRPETATLPDQ